MLHASDGPVLEWSDSFKAFASNALGVEEMDDVGNLLTEYEKTYDAVIQSLALFEPAKSG
jgi:hypothetical protein